MRADVVLGNKCPDYELTDHTRILRRLSDLEDIEDIDPMIVVLSRGHFCPRDHQQHPELAAFVPSSLPGTRRSSLSPRTTQLP